MQGGRTGTGIRAVDRNALQSAMRADLLHASYRIGPQVATTGGQAGVG
jgi:hypothetical protein